MPGDRAVREDLTEACPGWGSVMRKKGEAGEAVS